ncbi:hypothetical protein [Pseudomonas sp. PH1b]|uniref:hypothetical protein n=1 Tax=Pseudomonas sp. PH1b TaxID=1397282 RepID=UPI0012FF0B95|nr:hypothetical protein [Pseudomonas sp. PH1b]
MSRSDPGYRNLMTIERCPMPWASTGQTLGARTWGAGEMNVKKSSTVRWPIPQNSRQSLKHCLGAMPTKSFQLWHIPPIPPLQNTLLGTNNNNLPANLDQEALRSWRNFNE